MPIGQSLVPKAPFQLKRHARRQAGDFSPICLDGWCTFIRSKNLRKISGRSDRDFPAAREFYGERNSVNRLRYWRGIIRRTRILLQSIEVVQWNHARADGVSFPDGLGHVSLGEYDGVFKLAAQRQVGGYSGR